MQPADERPKPRPRPTPGPAAAPPPPKTDGPPAAEAGSHPFGTPTAGAARSKPALRIPAGVTPGVLVAAVGALLTFLAAFLTWASVDVASRVGSPLLGGGTTAVTGLEGARLGKATLVVALAALALCVLLFQPSSRSWAWIALASAGGLIVVLALLDAISISDSSDLPGRLAAIPACSSRVVQCTISRSVGIGVYLTILGGAVVVVGSLLHHGVFNRLAQHEAVQRVLRRPGRPTPAEPVATGKPEQASEPAVAESDAGPTASSSPVSESTPTPEQTAETGSTAT